MSAKEPTLASFVYSSILFHNTFESAVAFCLANKMKTEMLHHSHLHDEITKILLDNPTLAQTVRDDLQAVWDRDPACEGPLHALLFFKGFLALESYRIANHLYTHNRHELALCFQSRISEVFSVDIHPGAKLGKGILIDHATGLVIGETAVVGDGCSFLHEVTLGGTGKATGDRHPKLGNNVMVGCGVKILGNIRIGNNVKIGSNSVVLRPLPDNVTAVGVPASIVGKIKIDENPAKNMDQLGDLEDVSASLVHCSLDGPILDYVI